MRIVHMTDVHFLRPSGASALLDKRLLGLLNLRVLGRAHHFDADRVTPPLVADAREQSPDLFVMTGDLTALAQPAEFEAARRAFAPLLDEVPSVVVPGNHDTYTPAAVRAGRFEQHFGAWSRGGRWTSDGWDGAGGWPCVFSLAGTTVVATNPCRAAVRADGRFPDGAIAAAEAMVAEARGRGDQVVYLLHYPPVDSEGAPYRRKGHDLLDGDGLRASLRREPPDLVLHGHAHRFWRSELVADDGRRVPIVNCGSSSAVSPLGDRAGGYNLYELERGELRSVRRRGLLGGAAAVADVELG